MNDFASALQPFDLAKALAADRGDGCIVLDVGRDNNGQSVCSFKHVLEQVERHLVHEDTSPCAVTKLYIIGDWVLTEPDTEHKVDMTPQAQELKKRKDGVEKWTKAVKKVLELIEAMGNLQELTWVSGLPFMAVVWEKLPTTLTKLVLDLGQAVRLDQVGDDLHRSYITSGEMKPLQEQTKLKELRLFRVHESFQYTVWSTVFRNTSEGGMRVLDLQMAAAPLVRVEHWRKANDVVGLTVPAEESNEKEYKGMDGKGILHYAFGTGEYLDGLCIRKARIAIRLDENKPLPLWCLKLDGFVIDHLPFDDELSRLVLLTCADNCIDSGLRAPKTLKAPYNKWSRTVNNATSHCLIQWPNWTGIFDDHGDQRDTKGDVVSQELGLSTPFSEFPPSPSAQLTKEHLDLKDIGDALEIKDYFGDAVVGGPSSKYQASLSALSNLSTRGSEVPTPTVGSITTEDADVPDVDDLISPISSSSTVLVDGRDLDSPPSSFGSLERVSASGSDFASDVATAGSTAGSGSDDIAPKAPGILHKVRHSLGWLSGFES